MSVEKLINMIFKVVTRKLVNKGVDAGLNRLSGGDAAQAGQSKKAVRQARKAARMAGRV